MPTISITSPSTAFTDEAIIVDARLSTGISTNPQSDGSPSVTIDFGDGFTANLMAAGHAYIEPGTYTITVTGKDSGGSSASNTASITISNVPAATGGGIQNLTDSGNATTNATNLQNAINTAAAANSVEQEIRLNGSWGTVISGPTVLTRPTGGTKYITIVWTDLATPRNQRVSVSDMTNAPRINAPSATSASTAAMWTPNPAAANPSHHYRLIGLKFKKNSTDQSQVLMSLGDHNTVQTGYSMQPTYFLVDRCLFDGDSTGVSNLGLRICADYVTIKDSYFTGFKVVSGSDAVAVAISKGKGPWAIWNNYLEASSENFFIGGSDAPLESFTGTVSSPTTTSCTLSSVTGLEVDMNIVLPVGGATTYNVQYSTIVRSISGSNITFDAISTAPFNTGTAKWAITPSFLEYRRNYSFKPLTWRIGDPSYAGTHWQIKNLWETKALRYAVIDGNVLQNSWADAQVFAIALTPRKTNGFEHEAAVIRELQFSNNIFRNMANGVSIPAYDDQSGTNPVQLTRDITFRNNLWRNVGEGWDATSGPYRQFFSLTSTTSPVRAKNIHFVHQTFDSGTYQGTGATISVFGTNGDGSGMTGGTFVNNNSIGLGGFFSSSSSVPSNNIAQFMASALLGGNYIVNPNSLSYGAGFTTEVRTYPSGVYIDTSTGNFTLLGGTGGINLALDGTNSGVNMTQLNEATEGAVTGIWDVVPPPTVTVCRWDTSPSCVEI